MNKPSPALESFRTAAAALVDQDAAPEWLLNARAAGWQGFQQAGFPDRRNERWKYTRLTPFERRAFELPRLDSGQMSKAWHTAAFDSLPGPRLVFIDGCFDPAASRLDGVEGLRALDLAQALRDEDGVARDLLGTIAQSALHPFSALNAALLVNGAVLDVAPGARIADPVYLLFISTRATASFVSSPRILLKLGKNASLSVIEHHLAHEGAKNFVNVTVEGRLDDASRLDYCSVQDGVEGNCHLSGLHLEQDRNSSVAHNSISLGGRMIRNDLHSRLLGEGATISMNGLYMAGDKQHIDNHTLVEHAAPATRSSQDYKGILHGRGRAVFNGKVLIRTGAHGSDAQQSNSNLLLSENAEVDTKPELEIYNDDVKCSHGATVGQLDNEALHYLRSRGIGEATARTMLTFAFAEAVVQNIAFADIRRRIEERVIALLPERERIRSFV